MRGANTVEPLNGPKETISPFSNPSTPHHPFLLSPPVYSTIMTPHEVDLDSFMNNVNDDRQPSSASSSKETSTFDHRFTPSGGGMGARDSYQNDVIPFQLPSFLLGAPTPAAGGGADALPGSFATLADFNNWFGTGISSSDEYATPQSYALPSCSSYSLIQIWQLEQIWLRCQVYVRHNVLQASDHPSPSSDTRTSTLR